ncbi:hypothetical protein KAFR_0L02010 [Kazachstania africana CBS 2517]|uniref:alcohol dehydrogenase n=1 Tax=Kazachstania africana (strain ATCC 22294 / BCRC 22015 / CBS 2517 / CECT 1963 / NBRC 1671 / NRRL Y-8276) TaxID=1071382 RepID=H2B2G2_KAZAF|nr:hypothetical protein KAFR_0L02010 [Kazachstania africana CBS 2517]CCF60812.1 hypothetical protein KAFR_0L02010 [Kazachstania africana CBS 2517]
MSAPTIPKTQKAIIFSEVGGKLEYKDIPVPVPKSNELLINVLYSGVCHSDLHIWQGDLPLPLKLPLVGGHEGAGVVVGMGSNVKGWKLGDYAGIKFLNGTCNACEFCEQSFEISCPHADFTGTVHDGSFQQYATADAVQAARIPQGTDLAAIAPLLCAGLTAYKALKSANMRPGQWVAISGACGGLGTYAIQYATAMGYRVLGIDSGEEKAKYFKTLGGEVFIDYKKSKDVVADVIKATDGGAHGVLNIAVDPRAISMSTKYVRSNGTSVLVSLPKDAVCESEVFTQVVKSTSIVGSCVGNRADTREAIDFFTRGLIKIPIHMAPLSSLPQIYDKLMQNEVVGRFVVDTSK